ncbi:MAG TPA: hydroxyacid dehydrogenase [Rubrobacter sp.]|nr:hydroxyacid dehydrogenase [Rubrobacter sp.]
MRPRGLYALSPDAFDRIYGEAERSDIAALVQVEDVPQTAQTVADNPKMLDGVEVILSGWGAPVMDDAFLEAAGELRAIFYGAGSVRPFVTDALWERDVLVVSAYSANAVPVSEYALAAILFSLKRGWHLAAAVRERRSFPPVSGLPGAFGSTVGIVSLGATGRMLRERLTPFDVRVVAHDPYVTQQEASRLGVEPMTLDRIFREADVVSLHTPWLPETEGMIQGSHLASMKPGATFVNTSRGAVVMEAEMISVLKDRPDLTAVLDVTRPEPPEPDSPLYDMPNVVLTPHIAGSQGDECRRMGRLVVEELRRYVAGEPLQHEITRERAAVMA